MKQFYKCTGKLMQIVQTLNNVKNVAFNFQE